MGRRECSGVYVCVCRGMLSALTRECVCVCVWAEYLAKTALLAYLDPKAKATVIDAFQKRSFTNGDNIITQGDEGDFYYILDAGSADALLSKPPGSPEIKVAEYGSGGAFGELALIHGEPRAATVRATSDCQTYALAQ